MDNNESNSKFFAVSMLFKNTDFCTEAMSFFIVKIIFYNSSSYYLKIRKMLTIECLSKFPLALKSFTGLSSWMVYLKTLNRFLCLFYLGV